MPGDGEAASLAIRGARDNRRPADIGWLRRHWRLAAGALVAAVTALFISEGLRKGAPVTIIGAFDAGALATLILLWQVFRESSLAKMKREAVAQDAGQYLVLLIVLLASVTALTAIAIQVPLVKNAVGLWETFQHAAPLALTIVLSWVFMHTVFALHYAHDYFVDVELPSPGAPAKPSSRLRFPGGGVPSYADFLYFSFTIGMTFQVSDVQIADSKIRRMVLLHAVVAFFYTTGILALAINLVAGLAGK